VFWYAHADLRFSGARLLIGSGRRTLFHCPKTMANFPEPRLWAGACFPLQLEWTDDRRAASSNEALYILVVWQITLRAKHVKDLLWLLAVQE